MADPVYIAGAYEHPTREAPDKTTLQLHAEVARGALDDAGIEKDEVDAIFTAGQTDRGAPIGPQFIADYMGLETSYADTSDHGGSSYVSHVGHAASAIRNGKADVAVITLAGRPRSQAMDTGTGLSEPQNIHDDFKSIYGMPIISVYAMAAHRHMAEFGTTSEQLAEIRVAASEHAQYNEHAMFPDPVTVDDVVNSRLISDPLHLLDCCVISDGGGALVVVSDDVKDSIDRESAKVLGHGEYIKHHDAGRVDLTYTGARYSGPRAYEEAGVGPEDIDYASIYDSFTITVLETIEDLGFCEKGEGGEFVEGGALQAPDGDLPWNTDGGGQCSNHPDNRGGMTKMIEAVRQIRGEANPEVQVPDCEIALSHGTGGGGINYHQSATTILGRDD